MLVAASTFGTHSDVERRALLDLSCSACRCFLNFNLLIAFLQAQNRFLAMNAVTLASAGRSWSRSLVAARARRRPHDDERLRLLGPSAASAPSSWRCLLLGPRNLHLPTILWPRWPVLKAQVKFGVQGQAGNILQLLNYRLDKYIALAFVGTTGVGIYAIAVGVTESIWFISNAVAVVLVPRLTRAAQRRGRLR